MNFPMVNNKQSAVDTWYLRFLKNLETEYHYELAWNLVMMGRATESISIDVYKPFLNRHKPELLRAMLMAIANTDPDISYSDRELGDMMMGARKLGLAWPEFDTIEKSLRASNIVNESNDEHDEYRKHLMMHLKSDLLDKKYYDTFEVIQELNWCDDVPNDLKPLLDQHKQGMMTSLLKIVKHIMVGKYLSPKTAGFDLRTSVDGLRRLGVDWPELDTIEKSLGTNRNLRESIEIPKDLDEQKELITKHPWMIGNIWAPADELQRIVLKLDGSYLGSIRGGLSKEVIEEPDIRHNIIKHLLKLVKSGDLVSLGYRLEDLRWKNVSWPELDIIRKSLRASGVIKENGYDDILETTGSATSSTANVASLPIAAGAVHRRMPTEPNLFGYIPKKPRTKKKRKKPA